MKDDPTRDPATVSLARDQFLQKMLLELSRALEEIVGLESASGYIATVGGAMGRWIGEQYRQGLSVDHLGAEQLARVFVDLKQRIGGDFFIIDIDAEKIVIGNRRCPFGEQARGRNSLCQMTSNVFGRIAADNLGYARVELCETIAQGAPNCRIVVHLQPREDVEPDEREYYRALPERRAQD